MGKYSEQIGSIFDQAEQQGHYLNPSVIEPVQPKAEPTTPAPDTEERSVLKDAAGLWGVGSGSLVKGIGWLFGSDELQALGQDTVEYWQNTLSETQKEANQKPFVNDDWSLGEGATDLNTIFGTVVQSLPHMVPGMGAAGLAARGSLALGLSQKAAAMAAAGAGSAGEGVTIGAMVGQEVDETIKGMTEEEKMQSPYYADLRQLYSEEEATQRLSDMAANPAALKAGAVGAALGVAFNKFLGDALTRRLKGGVVGEGVKGGAIEGGTEVLQSGYENYSRQSALNEYADQPISYTGMVNEMVAGLAAGTTMGTAVGAAGGAMGQGKETPAPKPSTAERVKAARDQAKAAGADSLAQARAGAEELLRDIESRPEAPAFDQSEDIGGLLSQAKQQEASQAYDELNRALAESEKLKPAKDTRKRGELRPGDPGFVGYSGPVVPDNTNPPTDPPGGGTPLSDLITGTETESENGRQLVYDQDGVRVVQNDQGFEAQTQTDDGRTLTEFAQDPDEARRKLARLIEKNRPKEAVLQNRDRSRPAYVEQMQAIANEPDYDRVSVSREPNTGAPMVFPRGEAATLQPSDMGATDTVTMSDGQGGTRKIPVRYAVVEADQVTASNNADGSANEQYGKGGLTALNNGRTAGLQAAFKQGTAQPYVEAMLSDTAHGIAPEAIRSKKNPLLIRFFDESALEGIDDPGAASNVSANADLSAVEQAQTDARKLDPDLLNEIVPGDVTGPDNMEFVRRFTDVLGKDGQGNALRDTKGLLTAQGQKRIKGALVERAYQDGTITQELTEAVDNDLKTLGDALAQAAGRWSLMRERAREGAINPDMDITDALVSAVNMIRKSRQEGKALADLAGQVDAFAGPADQMAVELLHLFYHGETFGRIRAKDVIARTLLDYVDAALNTSPGPDMFGQTSNPQSVLEAQRGRNEAEAPSRVQPDGTDDGNDGTPGEGLERRPGGQADAEEGAGTEPEPAGEPESGPAREVEAAAQQADTSPTDAQKEAGNYQKGHVTIQGLNISIENPKGSTRSGTDPDGNRWERTLTHHYGYLKRTEGADGDHVDVFIGPAPDSDRVFIIDQTDQDGTFDEHKVMLGFGSRLAARRGYASNYEKGWKVGPITQMDMDEFKAWLEGDTTQPLSDSLQSTPVEPTTEPDGDFDLETQTEQQLAEQERQQQEAQQEEARRQREEEQRAKADDEAKDFVLSGSNSPVDQAEARGQGNMFDVMGRPEQTEAKPESGTDREKMLEVFRQIGREYPTVDYDAIGARRLGLVGRIEAALGRKFGGNDGNLITHAEKQRAYAEGQAEAKAGQTQEPAESARPKRRYGNPELHDTLNELTEQARNLPVSVRPEDVPYQLAHDAYAGMSHVPDDRALQEQIEYMQEMLGLHEQMSKLATTEEKQQTLKDELRRYKENYLKHNRAVLQAKSRTMSPMITGGSNFPTRRNQKRLSTEQKRIEEFLAWRGKARKAIHKALTPEQAPISSTDSDALTKLQKKLEGLEQTQERMKAANKIVRRKNLSDDEKIQSLQDEAGLSRTQANELLKPDFAGRVGFPSYALSNNNAEIRRVKQRIEELQTRQETSEQVGGLVTAEFEGGTVELDYKAGYVRIMHDDKPSAEVRQQLKSNGFRWTPSETAWRRKLNNQAIYRAKQITGVTIPEQAVADGTALLYRKEGVPYYEVKEDQLALDFNAEPDDGDTSDVPGGQGNQGDSEQAGTTGRRKARVQAFQTTRQIERQSYFHGLRSVNTAAEAAHVLAPFRKDAQETMLGLVLDKQRRPLAIIRHTKGTVDGAPVYPKQFVADMASVPGADAIWLSHNHPSGKTEPSAADRNLTNALRPVIQEADLNLEGHAVIGFGRAHTPFDMAGESSTDNNKEGITEAAVRKHRIPVLERQILKQTNKDLPVIKMPSDAKRALQMVAKPEQTGLMLLDNQHRPAGFLDLTGYDLEALRDSGVFRQVLEAMAQTNGNAVIIQAGKGVQDTSNLQRMVADFGDELRLLDAVHVDRLGKAKVNYYSVAESGGLERSGAWFSRDGEYRRAPESRINALTATEAQQAVGGLMAGWKGKPKVNVADNISDFPKGLRDAIRLARAESNMRAVLWNNEVYILAPRIPNESALQEVILHEAIGHYGLRKMLGSDLKPLLQRVYMAMGKTPQAEALKWTYYKGKFDPKNTEHRLTIAEELIAHLAESNQHQKLWNRIKSAIRDGLRKLGFTLELNDTDLLKLLRGAQRTVEQGGISRPSQFDAYFRLAYHGTPHRFDKFSLEAIGTGEGAQAYGWGLYFAGNREVADYYRTEVSKVAVADKFLDDLPENADYEEFSDWVEDADLPPNEKEFMEALIENDLLGFEYPAQAINTALKKGNLERYDPTPRLVEAVKKVGNLYEVEIPDDNQLLDWDSPLNDQPEGITEAVRTVTDNYHGEGTFDAWMEANEEGGDYREWRDNLMEDLSDQELASRLNDQGVPGLRYLDGSSRNTDWQISPPEETVSGDWMVKDANRPNSKGLHFDTEAEARVALKEKQQASHNYVIWDESVVTVQAVNDEIAQAEAYFSRSGQTDTDAFKRWFGDSKVVDKNGEPLVVYHGSRFGKFDAFRPSMHDESALRGISFSPDPAVAERYANNEERHRDLTKAIEPEVYAVYVQSDRLPDAMTFINEVESHFGTDDYTSLPWQDVVDYGRSVGVRAIDASDMGIPDELFVIDPTAIKSADNAGTFDPDNPDIRFSRTGARLEHASEHFQDLDDNQRSALNKIAPRTPKESAREWISERTDRWQTKLRQGMVDRFAALMDVDEAVHGKDVVENSTASSSWVLAQMAGAASGALQAMLTQGRIWLDTREKVIKMQEDSTAGLNDTLKQLGNAAEIERFFGWIAGNRSQKLMEQGRENLFEPDEVEALARLNEGTTDSGDSRAELYDRVFEEFQQFRDDVLQVADAAGLLRKGMEEDEAILFLANKYEVSPALAEKYKKARRRADNAEDMDEQDEAQAKAGRLYVQLHDAVADAVENFEAEYDALTTDQRDLWANEFYVPFYRVTDNDSGVTGPLPSSGLSRQQAYKRLKGGTQNLNDLLENTMMNFHHLLQASLKNQAAEQAIKNAEALGIARRVTESNRDTENSTFVLEDGVKAFYEIDDPLVFKAVTALAHPGMNSTAMKVMRSFKRLFTNMTTTTPQFIIANLLRDSMQASATSEVSKNMLKNMAQGSKAYGNKRTRARMMASGGSFSFGHLYGENADEVRLQLTGGLAQADVLRSPSMIPAALRGIWRRWNEVTDFTENVNRAAIFEQNRQTKGDLYAAFKARDLMNFSQYGAWPAMRVLIDVVPFLNARLQGLDKIYRSGVKPGIRLAFGQGGATDKQAMARFWTVTGALALASMALFLKNRDDEEFQKLEEWQKDTYWFLRTGEDTAIFIPKPFEVGAIATLVERLTEQAVSDTATGELFAERLSHMLLDTFSFSPVPQMFQPALDVYANYDAFTDRPIESMGMERLSPSLRARGSTTSIAKGASKITESVFGPDGKLTLSPVQIDHMIQGYFGSVGSWVAGVGDTIWKTANGETAPDKRWYEYQPVKRFYKNLGDEDRYTRYGTVFYEALKESNRVYADIMEYQELGKMESALEVLEKNRQKLAVRRTLNQVQAQLRKISQRMQQVYRMPGDSEYKRRELDRLRAMRNRIQEAVGKRLEQLNASAS